MIPEGRQNEQIGYPVNSVLADSCEREGLGETKIERSHKCTGDWPNSIKLTAWPAGTVTFFRSLVRSLIGAENRTLVELLLRIIRLLYSVL